MGCWMNRGSIRRARPHLVIHRVERQATAPAPAPQDTGADPLVHRTSGHTPADGPLSNSSDNNERGDLKIGIVAKPGRDASALAGLA